MNADDSWPLAAFLTSLPLDFPEAVTQAAALGFSHVDIVALVERPRTHLEALADSGVLVGCAALGRHLPPDHTLDAADIGLRRETVRLVQRQLDDAARLGALTAYVVPGTDMDPVAEQRFSQSVAVLADHAAERMVRLCVEHIPGRSLSTAVGTLAWLRQLAHPNLGLLLDIGHCLISGEDAAAVARDAGPLLGHVHLDDNDGVGDLHWPLLTGKLTLRELHNLAAALVAIDYSGGLALELNPSNANPEMALREGKALAERIFTPSVQTGE